MINHIDLKARDMAYHFKLLLGQNLKLYVGEYGGTSDSPEALYPVRYFYGTRKAETKLTRKEVISLFGDLSPLCLRVKQVFPEIHDSGIKEIDRFSVSGAFFFLDRREISVFANSYLYLPNGKEIRDEEEVKKVRNMLLNLDTIELTRYFDRN